MGSVRVSRRPKVNGSSLFLSGFRTEAIAVPASVAVEPVHLATVTTAAALAKTSSGKEIETQIMIVNLTVFHRL